MSVKPKRHSPARPPSSSRTLAEFLLAKRRQGCPICDLDPAIRDQLKEASKKAVRRQDQIEWLEQEFGLSLTRAAFDAHHSGRHEQG